MEESGGEVWERVNDVFNTSTNTNMGFFDFFKRHDKPIKAEQPAAEETSHKQQLDIIQKGIDVFLKPLGFKKKGRTYNREIEKGIFQVIDLQSARHNFEERDPMSFKDIVLGKFTVNLGVCIQSVCDLNQTGEKKSFYKEYECQIRYRLGVLIKGQDFWWETRSDNADKIIKEITTGLSTIGFDWFSGIDSKGKIIINSKNIPYNSIPRTQLDVALMVFFDDREKGSELFQEYWKNISEANRPHKNYVKNIAKELGIELL